MLSSLLLFLVYSIPPLAGWWLCFRTPFGRRRFRASLHIAAPVEAVWRRLDPLERAGGWSFLHESRSAAPLSQDPLILASERRARHSHGAYERVEEDCARDEAARSVSRQTRGTDGARWDATVESDGDGARIHVAYETRITGLLAYELTRLALARDLAALEDAVLGRDAREAPLFRFSGWRLALLSVVSGVVMVLLILAPAFYVALASMGVSAAALLTDPAALAFTLAMALAMAFFFAAILLAATLTHEIGHALALALFGHRGVMVSLIPFGGGVSRGGRDHESAFEAGCVGLAGPALSAVVAFALLPDPATLSTLLQGLSGAEPDYPATLRAVAGAAFVLLTLLVNIPNLLPWTGSDGALALGAIFRGKRLRQIAAGAFAALLVFIFAGLDDLLPFGLMFLALSWFNRNRREAPQAGAVDPRRGLEIAAGLAMVVALCAHEASALRAIEWTPPPGAPAQSSEKI